MVLILRALVVWRVLLAPGYSASLVLGVSVPVVLTFPLHRNLLVSKQELVETAASRPHNPPM